MSPRTANRELHGKVIAITGGARGIGLATANAFARRGAVVTIGDLDAADARVAAEGIGSQAIGLALDVTDRASFESFLNAVEHRLGPLDVMVNNAGIQHVGLFADESDASTDIQIAVNLGGVLTGTRLAHARMRPRGRGHIVNVASVAGRWPRRAVCNILRHQTRRRRPERIATRGASWQRDCRLHCDAGNHRNRDG